MPYHPYHPFHFPFHPNIIRNIRYLQKKVKRVIWISILLHERNKKIKELLICIEEIIAFSFHPFHPKHISDCCAISCKSEMAGEKSELGDMDFVEFII